MPTLRRQHEELREIDEPIDFFITSGTDEYDGAMTSDMVSDVEQPLRASEPAQG